MDSWNEALKISLNSTARLRSMCTTIWKHAQLLIVHDWWWKWLINKKRWSKRSHIIWSTQVETTICGCNVVDHEKKLKGILVERKGSTWTFKNTMDVQIRSQWLRCIFRSQKKTYVEGLMQICCRIYTKEDDLVNRFCLPLSKKIIQNTYIARGAIKQRNVSSPWEEYSIYRTNIK